VAAAPCTKMFIPLATQPSASLADVAL